MKMPILVRECDYSEEKITAGLEKLRQERSQRGTDLNRTKYHYFLELLWERHTPGSRKWYYTDGSSENIFSKILRTGKHPKFCDENGQHLQSRVYRAIAQRTPTATSDIFKGLRIFDTKFSVIGGEERPIAYRISKNGEKALKGHFQK